MFDAMKLLGALFENRSAPSSGTRLANAAGNTGSSGPLHDLLSQWTGGQQPGGRQAGGLDALLSRLAGGNGTGSSGIGQGGADGLFGGLADMARRAMASPGQEFQSNNPAAVGGLGALAGALLGGGRGAVGGGLMAVLGSLAYAALQGQGPRGPAGSMVQSTGSDPGFAALPGYTDRADLNRKATLLLRAMIQSAKADGQIDTTEMNRIAGKLDEAGEDLEARNFVLQQMTGPQDLEGLARDAKSTQEAAEVYGASLLAIEVDTPGEQAYLERLANALGLSRTVVGRMHGSVGLNQ